VSEYDSNNVFLISGTDEPRIEKEAAKIVRAVAGEDPDPFSLDVIRERDGAAVAAVIGEVIRSIRTPPFLGGRKTVWLRGFSGFKAEGKTTDKTPEARAFHELVAQIKNGIPDDIVLVLSGPGIDGAKSLARACKKHGKALILKKIEVEDRDWRAAMGRAIDECAAEKGVTLSREVRVFLVDALGPDPARIDPELEKLICYCGGPEKPITLEAAEALVDKEGEEAFWAFGEALGKRDPGETLRVLDVFLRQSKKPESDVLGFISRAGTYFRDLLGVKVFMHEQNLRQSRDLQRALDAMDAADKRVWTERGIRVATMHPYRAGKLADQAGRYTGRELIHAIRDCCEAFRKCVSTSVPPRAVLEEFIVRAVRPAGRR
jgi:DNA polymerase III delta subunit